MKKYSLHLFLIVTIFLYSTNGFSLERNSSYKNIYRSAEELFVNENYTAALPLYIKLDSMDKGNHNLNFKIGFCYLKAATYKTKAIPYLEFAINNIAKRYEQGATKERQAPFSSYYYLAKAYHFNYEFDKAIVMYQKYLTELGTDTKYQEEIDEINHDIETCNFGKELIKKPKTITIQNLGEAINTKFPDYAPIVSLDEQTLIFTSRREGVTSVNKLPNGEYYEDIFISTYIDDKWSKATPIGPTINSVEHEASINLSADGLKLLIYKDDGGDGNIYTSELKGTEWSVPKFASAPINSSSWESHACFSSNNRVLYFTSNRPGGFGGRDIYKCLKLPNGDWGPAQNLGDVINTKYDEDGIFIHPDGKQIFFSSKGHNSMGGFDIFTSMINDENGYWSRPVNYGYPVNTTDDDVFLVTSADGSRAFFSSDKEGGFGEKDIYMIKFPEFETRDITVLLGKIINNSNESIENNQIYIIEQSKMDTLMVLNANGASGKFGTNLPVGKTYRTVYVVNNEEIYSEIINVQKGKQYQVIKRNVPYKSAMLLSAIDSAAQYNLAIKNGIDSCKPEKSTFQLFFKYNKKEIDIEATAFKSFINALENCIKTNPEFKIYIEASASKVPTNTFISNQNLANLRAKNAKEKVTEALTKKGLTKTQILFSETKAFVQGPDYQKDALENKTTYEQYQFIKITVSQKK